MLNQVKLDGRSGISTSEGDCGDYWSIDYYRNIQLQPINEIIL